MFRPISHGIFHLYAVLYSECSGILHARLGTSNEGLHSMLSVRRHSFRKQTIAGEGAIPGDHVDTCWGLGWCPA